MKSFFRKQNNRKFKFSPACIKMHEKRIYILHTDHKKLYSTGRILKCTGKFMYVQEKKAVQSSHKRSEKFPTKV